jgi:succinate dehydrogenase/fumarate reductase-like Fe-S protein
MALTGRAVAWLNLAFRFGQHVAVRMPARLVRRGSDLPRFLAAVGPEGYLPLLEEERAALPAAMACIHCGLCSLACPALQSAPASAWDEAWTFVAGPSRSIDRAPLAAAAAGACGDCAACAGVCPTGVPIPQLAALVRRMAGPQPGDP